MAKPVTFVAWKAVNSNSFIVKTLDLTKYDLATDEDRKYNIDAWARLFKAETWETVKELCKDNPYIEEAAKSMSIMTEDKMVKENLIRRKAFYASMRRKDERIDQLMQSNTELTQSNSQLMQSNVEKDKCIAEKDKRIAEKDKRIAELEALLKEKQ